MAQTPALFVAHGPAGAAFGPFGPYQCATRRELVATVDSVIQALGMAGRARRAVDLVRIWRAIQRQGNGAAHFVIEDATTRARVHFHNLTPAEAESWEPDD